ncbi:thiamine pyrophosphokinase [Jannaschia pagri]|uniref:Thiamine diphosphokinase n=1 Tax=Jannaschia pagri TaxID=2829797 RepID=A0ABQ4NKJ4_9RHOB|nr:thiamine pyrophosphokinase [Jannaschia sp. AI_61]GIT94724.1 thiamine pyrophosphokinase [Jannaschia sp. AI_62]
MAVDGGANDLLAQDIVPDRLVGDLDSASAEARTAFAEVTHHIAEQDSTDFAKALRTSEAPWVIGVGFLGRRVDHFLACLSEMARRPACPQVILLGEVDCLCLLPRRVTLDIPIGSRVSLWPLGQARGRSLGLRWPVDGLVFEPAGQVGTSNRSVAPEVTIDMEGGPVALILASDNLEAMLHGLKIDPRPVSSDVL